MYNSPRSNPRPRRRVCDAINSRLAGEVMPIHMLLFLWRAFFMGAFLLAFVLGAFARDQPRPAGNPPAKKSKASADSCDGALDIVPVKSMTFTRKRRPPKAEQPNP